MDPRGRKTILLVEDEVLIAMAQKLSLERYGYTVILAPTGERAIELHAKDDAVDLVLMDIDLGRGIDGSEAAIALLKERTVPIVFLSSHTELEIVEKTERITSYGYVVKNSGITVLDASIKMAFKLFEANRMIVENQAKQKVMISNISDVIGIIGVDGIMKYKSPNIEKWFGWRPEDLVGTDGWLTVHPDDLGRIQREFAALLLADQSTTTVEYRYKCRDGSYKPIELTATNMVNVPAIGGVLLNYRDITDRRKAEDGLRESEHRYRSLFDNMTEGFALHELVCDEQGQPCDYRFLDVNSAFEKLTGLRREDILGKRQMQVTPGEDSFWFETYRDVALTGESVRLEHYSPALGRHYGVFAYRTEPSRFAVIFSDISERKRAEEALRASEERFRAIVENSAAGYFFLDREGRFRSVNDAWLRLHGYDSPAEVLGRHFSIVQVDADQERAQRIVEGFLKGGPVPFGEVSRRRRDGSVAWHTFSITPVRHGGAVVGLEGFLIDITSRKAAENEARKLLSQWKALVDHAPYLISIIDEGGTFQYLNRTTPGIHAKDVLGTTTYDYIAPEHQGLVRERIGRVFRDGCVEHYEIMGLGEGGRRDRWYETYVAPIHVDGVIVSATQISRDITESRRAEAELRESNEYLNNLFDYANAPIITWDSGFRITRFNQAFGRLTGRSQAEVLGKTLDLLFPDDTRTASMELIQKALAGERWETVEIPILARDGGVRVVIWNSANVLDPDGRPVSTIAQGVDITERKLAEARLGETNYYLNNLFDYANAPIITWDPSFRITRFNHAFEHLTDRSQEEVLDRTLDLLFPDETRELSMDLIRKALEGERWESVEIPILTKEGSIRTVIWNSANVLDAEGRTISTIAQGVDISDRKRSEEEVRKLLAEKELILREVHHRIKNNMNNIHSLLDFQAETAAEQATALALRDAGGRVKSMMLLYEKLYQSSDVNKLSVKSYIPDLVDEIIANFPNRASVRVEKEIGDFDLDARVLQPLGIVINELLTNIMKYAFAAEGHGTIMVALALRDSRVRLVVRDDGRGIPEKVDVENSTGFGLMLVGALARQLSGRLDIGRGSGTTFVLEFPA